MNILTTISNWYKRLTGTYDTNVIEETSCSENKFDYNETKNRLVTAGWKLFYRHERLFDMLSGTKDNIYLTRNEFEKYKKSKEENSDFSVDNYNVEVCPWGGRTQLTLVSPTGTEYKSTALCSSDDCYSRPIGRSVALERCMRDNGITLE